MKTEDPFDGINLDTLVSGLRGTEEIDPNIIFNDPNKARINGLTIDEND